MALRTRAEKTGQVTFRKVGQTGIFFVNTEANHKESMELLRLHELRPLTYQEAIANLAQNPELKKYLQGTRFYLDGEGSQLSEYLPGYYTFNKKGELTQEKGDVENTVYFYKGTQPLSLLVHTDAEVRWSEMRYDLDADTSPVLAAWTVVGVRAGHSVATPKEEGVKFTGVTTEQLLTTLQRNSAQRDYPKL